MRLEVHPTVPQLLCFSFSKLYCTESTPCKIVESSGSPLTWAASAVDSMKFYHTSDPALNSSTLISVVSTSLQTCLTSPPRSHGGWIFAQHECTYRNSTENVLTPPRLSVTWMSFSFLADIEVRHGRITNQRQTRYITRKSEDKKGFEGRRGLDI